MRRPSPWVWIPALFGFAAGAAVGWVVTRIGCLPEGCLGWQVAVAIAAGSGAAIGVLVVVVLALRSLDEWRSGEKGN